MCDTIAAVGAATAFNTVLFGKNSDREFDEAQSLQLIPAAHYAAGTKLRLTHVEIDQAGETYAVLLSQPHWIWGAEIGANEHGLVIGNEALYSKIPASTNDGIIGMDYLRLALERARGVDEAIAVMTGLLRQHGQGGRCGFKHDVSYHNSFILSDRQGAKVLETVDREWVVTSIEDYYAISNVMTLEDSFEDCSPTLRSRAVEAQIYRSGTPFAFGSIYQDDNRKASGHYRRNRAMELLGARRGSLQPADFFGVLRDHRQGPPAPGRTLGPRLCAHEPGHPLGHTTASWVADLTPGKTVHWITGTAAPCTGLFKPVLFETGLPDHGARPHAQEDGSSLWWRHERLRRLLETVDSDRRDEFFRERDAVEADFLEAMAKCPPVEDDRTREEAWRLVSSCWQVALAFESRWCQVVNAAASCRAR